MSENFVLIVSQDGDDSTSIVIKWVLRLGGKVFRTGNQNNISAIEIENVNKEFDIIFTVNKINEIKLSQIKSFWYRKSELNLLSDFKLALSNDYQEISDEYYNYLINEELKALRDFVIFSLERKKFLGNIKAENGNKLISFEIARQVGFKTPNYFISSSSEKLKAYSSNKQAIIKPIQDGFRFHIDKLLYKNYYCNKIDNELFQNLESEIFPSCIQDYINKKIEIRTFYLNGKTYSMAIFSQENLETQVDFRNYSLDKPNRNVPFILPKDIDRKIDLFMNKIGLNTGSIDLILTHENEYYFLEVNPTGQYGMIEQSCFYGLDKKIADFLTD